jgi:flagellar export protein FliJ
MARRFRFPLETLLRVRVLREREAKRKVAAQRAEIARLDRLNRQTAEEISRQQAELLTGQQRGRLDPPALQRGRAWIAHLRRTIALRQTQRLDLVAQLQQLQAAWLEARKQARILDKLRARRWEAYVHERARAEQAAADELARQLLTRNVNGQTEI